MQRDRGRTLWGQSTERVDAAGGLAGWLECRDGKGLDRHGYLQHAETFRPSEDPTPGSCQVTRDEKIMELDAGVGKL